MGLKNYIKDRDQFGHPISLNFSYKGDTHNTILGGLLSVIVNVMLLYVIFEKGNHKLGDYVMVKIDDCTSATLKGKVI